MTHEKTTNNSHETNAVNDEDQLGPPKDVSEENIYKIDGPSGPCFIAWVGGMPEREHTFVYRDKAYFFYFYARTIWEGAIYDVDIENATVAKFTGPHPSVRSEDIGRIAENIKIFFENRMFLDSSVPRPSAEKFRNLIFSWRVVR